MTGRILKCFDAADFKILGPSLAALSQTKAAKADISTSFEIKLLSRMVQPLYDLDAEAFDDWIRAHTTMHDEQREITAGISGDANPGLKRRSKLMESIWYPLLLDAPLRVDQEHHLAVLGVRGENIEKHYSLYDRETDHADMKNLLGVDMLCCCTSFSVQPLLYIWGEVERAQALVQFHVGEVGAEVPPPGASRSTVTDQQHT